MGRSFDDSKEYVRGLGKWGLKYDRISPISLLEDDLSTVILILWCFVAFEQLLFSVALVPLVFLAGK